MDMLKATPVFCPNCHAQYRVIRVEAAATSKLASEVICLSCGGPLNAREGAFILKYLLVREGQRGRRRFDADKAKG